MISLMRKEESNTDEELPDIVRMAYRGDAAGVARLLQNGADVNSVDPSDNLTILHIACLQGDLQLANVILDHDKNFGDVDFTIKSLHRPRLAWQFAMNGNFTELAELVDGAGLRKAADKAVRPIGSKPQV